MLAAAITASAFVWLAPETTAPIVRTTIVEGTFTPGMDRTFAMTPDGTRLAIVSSDATEIRVRPFDALDSTTVLDTTAFIHCLFASPDGQWIGYVENNLAPEQITGSIVDRRADIWAFGCVLYEMLTASRAFGGASVPEMLAAVLGSDPDWSRLPASVPTAVRRLLRGCLVRDPRQRLSHLAVARFALDENDAIPTTAANGGRRTNPRFWVAGVLPRVTVGGLGGVAHFDVSANGTLVYPRDARDYYAQSRVPV